MGPAGPCRRGYLSGNSAGAARRVAPPFCLVRHTLRLARARAATAQAAALHPTDARSELACDAFHCGGCCTLLLYEALEPRGQIFELWSMTWVELWGFEPQTSCMPYSGNTSTAVHLCRSPSQDVRISPPESRPVAVLSCCTVPSVHRCKLSGLCSCRRTLAIAPDCIRQPPKIAAANGSSRNG